MSILRRTMGVSALVLPLFLLMAGTSAATDRPAHEDDAHFVNTGTFAGLGGAGTYELTSGGETWFAESGSFAGISGAGVIEKEAAEEEDGDSDEAETSSMDEENGTAEEESEPAEADDATYTQQAVAVAPAVTVPDHRPVREPHANFGGAGYREVATTAGPEGAASSGTIALAQGNKSVYHQWSTAAGKGGAASSGTHSVAGQYGSKFHEWSTAAGPAGAATYAMHAVASARKLR